MLHTRRQAIFKAALPSNTLDSLKPPRLSTGLAVVTAGARFRYVHLSLNEPPAALMSPHDIIGSAHFRQPARLSPALRPLAKLRGYAMVGDYADPRWAEHVTGGLDVARTVAQLLRLQRQDSRRVQNRHRVVGLAQ